MASNFGGFDKNLNKGFNKNIEDPFKGSDFAAARDFKSVDNAFRFTPESGEISRIRYYDKEALWTRWRRGYELFTITQSVLASTAKERKSRGDYRMYCVYQLFPGVFVPARLFTFPTYNQEIREQIVGMRDANGFNFYNFGLSILAVRYLSEAVTGTYGQSGTTITVTKSAHGYQIGNSVYLVFTSGTAVSNTFIVTSITADTFTCVDTNTLTTSGGVQIQRVTTFNDTRWNEMRVRLRSIFEPIPQLIGERLVDRVIEKDPGIFSSYSRTGSTVTVNCVSPHGLSTGNSAFAIVTSGTVSSALYTVTVTSPTQLTFQTYDSGITSGNLVINRLIKGYRYDDYVGYTLASISQSTNELVFQRDDSYGTKTDTSTNNIAKTVVPAHRGFQVGRFLTTELRYQCSCQDFSRQQIYNFTNAVQKKKFPSTPIRSVKPGQREKRDGTIINQRDEVGVYSDLGYVNISNFYTLPDYGDKKSDSFLNLAYYQMRWCKHIYAALFSLQHDEGNEYIEENARYVQTGANINVTVFKHGLEANTKVFLDVTSGSVDSGDYTITQIIDENTFQVVYPFSNNTSGYCTVRNTQEHGYVKTWLLEPNDKPVGDALDLFYKNLNKESGRLLQAAQRQAMMQKGMNWAGSITTLDSKGQPVEVGNFNPELAVMEITDDHRRNEFGRLDRTGVQLNRTETMTSMMNKLLNIPPYKVLSENFGMLTEPLNNYPGAFQFGKVDCGAYLNGVPYSINGSSTTLIDPITGQPNTYDASSVIILDCGGYNPFIPPAYVINAGTY